MVKIVINADDYGCDETVNKAIIQCFNKKLITSTTIMANMPCFEQACSMANDNGFLNMLGIHLNITCGTPLTNEIKICQRFCNSNGIFNFKRSPFCMLSRKEEKILGDELEAQIEKCRAFGIKITHADSHQHIHTLPGIGNIVLMTLKKKNISALRLSRKKKYIIKNIYAYLFNGRIRRSGFYTTDDFYGIEDVVANNILLNEDQGIEVMVHPKMVGNDVYDHTLNIELIPHLKCIHKKHTVVEYGSAVRTTA